MGIAELEAKMAKMENTIKDLSSRLTVTQDIQEIEKLQRIYGYLLDFQYHKDVVDLFSDDTESVEVAGRGIYLGKKGAERFFLTSQGAPREPWQMAHHMQLQGVGNVNADGKTAFGRWHVLFMCVGGWGEPPKPTAAWGFGLYENTYVKENGKWLFKKLYFNRIFYTPFDQGWVKVPDMSRVRPPETADLPSTTHHPYPAGYVIPFHFNNPITGKAPKR